VFAAVEELRGQGIITGYPDGTFQPERKVNRAEALKMLVAQTITPEELQESRESVFEDVPAEVWYLPYLEAAWERGIIDGPPKRPSFEGERLVLKAEFLKMLLTRENTDFTALSNFTLPLSSDSTNPEEWYYPYLRAAITASLTMADTEGLLHPGKELTRAEVALFLYHFIQYKEKRRTQALLSEAEAELGNILHSLARNDITSAEYASARSLLAVRGAHASHPDIPTVQGALKITEAFHALVQGYRAGLDHTFEKVISLAQEAWHLADQARRISPTMEAIAEELQESAHSMAENARALMEQSS
jgi:hypothetical protein